MKLKLSGLSRLGKALMLPVAAMPAAGILLRLGQGDVLNLPWMSAAGGALFDNLPLIFAIGIAIGLAEENNGTAALAAAIGYNVIIGVAKSLNAGINMGVFAGIIAGVVAASLYNRFKEIQLPNFLGFFGGKRFVPIITSFATLLIGLLCGFIWPPIQNAIDTGAVAMTTAGPIGTFLFGTINRALIPLGLHHVINSVFWFQLGTFGGAQGDLWRFFAGDPTAGTYMAGFFPIMMFGLPAACAAMVTAAKKENRAAITGVMISVALTAFLTGITEPIEFLFMFLAPWLYVIHAVLTGLSMAVCQILGLKLGFTFSAGAIDYVLGYGISTKPLLLLPLGLAFGLLYYFIFLFVIKKFDLPTPGRLEEGEESYELAGLRKGELYDRAKLILEALGGSANIENIDSCITRVRLTAKNGAQVDEAALKRLGVNQVMKMGDASFQLVVGTIADPLTTNIRKAMKEVPAGK